jgi:hypothetical protein
LILTFGQCAVLAGVVIGSFSWNTIQNSYWVAPALWYGSLVFSILGILLAAQQIAVLDLLGSLATKSDQSLARAYVHRYLPLLLSERQHRELETAVQSALGEWKPRRKMIFIWQCGTMFMSYSVTLYLAGLTIFVCAPLIQEGAWSSGGKVSNSHTPVLFFFFFNFSLHATTPLHPVQVLFLTFP